MATRFRLANFGAPPVSPAFDAGWEQTGEATRMLLLPAPQAPAIKPAAAFVCTVPITTAQDILCAQFVSAPLKAQLLSGTFSLSVSVLENSLLGNVTLAAVAKVVGQDGALKNTLYSTFDTDVEFGTSSKTRIVNAVAITPAWLAAGDRVVVEVGGHAATPLGAGTFTMNFEYFYGSDSQLSSDQAPTDPWCEFSADLFGGTRFSNYQSVRVGDGMGTTERVR